MKIGEGQREDENAKWMIYAKEAGEERRKEHRIKRKTGKNRKGCECLGGNQSGSGKMGKGKPRTG